MAEDGRPLLNPVLALRIEPKREARVGGGKGRNQIVQGRLATQRQALAGQFNAIYREQRRLRVFGGRVQLLARMFADSYAPSHTPDSLFSPGQGMQLIAPFHDSYLVEAEVTAVPRLASFVAGSDTVAAQVDISRVQAVGLFGREEVLRGRSIDSLWDRAPDLEDGKAFIVSFAPFQNTRAREQLLQAVGQLTERAILLPTWPSLRLPSPDDGTDDGKLAVPVVSDTQTSLAIAMRRYRNSGRAHATVRIVSKDALGTILASGTVFRLDPVPKIEVTTPGDGKDPGPLPPQLAKEPIVAIVDGGRTAKSYEQAEAWREPALVPDGLADAKHGNRVTALAVHGHAWNANLPLPKLFCRVGTVQAVPRANANYPPDLQKLVHYIDRVMDRHPETRVWNFSFNQVEPCDADEVSILGHELARLARQYKILPVISAGNRIPSNKTCIAPPADCEAAIVVAGRKFDSKGQPAGACDVSLPGPGPQGMLKPDMSWFSQLRVLGGEVLTATSFPTPLVASLAAHTFHNLKDATPDFVRALLINKTDLDAFETKRGWGSPDGVHLPWTCQPGTVTLAWRGELKPGQAYYWERIPIPARLIRKGKLHGRGSLTAIIEPLTSETLAGNYFASRLEVALQYQSTAGKTKSLLGTMKTSVVTEHEARSEFHKWNPVRRHCNDFTKNGLTFSGRHMRLYARVYARDLYQFGMRNNEDVGTLKAAFVLTLSDGTETGDLYNEMRTMLGNFVESAVLDQDIDIQH